CRRSCARNRSTQLKARRDGRECAVRAAQCAVQKERFCAAPTAKGTKKSCAFTDTGVIPSREDGEESPSHVRRSSSLATGSHGDLIMRVYRHWCHSEPRRRRGIPLACATLVVLGAGNDRGT